MGADGQIVLLQPDVEILAGFLVDRAAEVDTGALRSVPGIQPAAQRFQLSLAAAMVTHQHDILKAVDHHAGDHRLVDRGIEVRREVD